MIKSVNQLITERCNSRCKMCSIWKIKNKSYEMTPQEFNKFYSRIEFREVEDLCISGGEPTLRLDLFEITDNIIKNLPKLRMLFFSTNGSNPKISRDFIIKYAPKVKDIYICISLEGEKETHEKIRGIENYDKVIETARLVRKLNLKNCHIVFSTTIVPENCNKESLNHIKYIAKKFKGSFSFRPASKNNTFYHNKNSKNLTINPKQLKFLTNYLIQEKIYDPFLEELFKFIKGEETVIYSKNKKIKCLAGDISVFIKPNGNIFPCINSSRLIGNREKGIFKLKYKLGNKELCPCCTECQIYPILNFSSYSKKYKPK
jgi:MoaA/NifB/PqqE/SkfB family radical SAM enzyme